MNKITVLTQSYDAPSEKLLFEVQRCLQIQSPVFLAALSGEECDVLTGSQIVAAFHVVPVKTPVPLL